MITEKLKKYFRAGGTDDEPYTSNLGGGAVIFVRGDWVIPMFRLQKTDARSGTDTDWMQVTGGGDTYWCK